MLTSAEKSYIAAQLSQICDVPIQFAELIINIEKNDEFGNYNKSDQMTKRIERVKFLDNIANETNFILNEEKEFQSQCLAIQQNTPIQICRIVIQAEDDNINDDQKNQMRIDRLEFVSNIFKELLTKNYYF